MTPSPARWLRIRVRSPSEDANALLSEGLIASGGLAVEEEGEWLSTWIADEGSRSAEHILTDVRSRLEQIANIRVNDIEWQWKPNEDWLSRWRAGLGPRRTGHHLWITPTWTQPDAQPNDIVIRIDPQMAFGTGEHASTRGMLRLLEDSVTPGVRMLDVGTGSGVLAIAAVHLGAGFVDAVDVDTDAITNARENVQINGCADRVHLAVARVDDAYLTEAGAYDIIAANILSSVIRPLLPGFQRHLRPGGSVLVGGILEDESREIVEAARAVGLKFAAEDREEGWWSARLRKSRGPEQGSGDMLLSERRRQETAQLDTL